MLNDINKFLLLLQDKKFNEARTFIDSQNIEIDNGNKYALKGILELEQKNYDQAIQYLKKASFIFPKNFAHNFNLAIAMGKKQQISDAIKQFKICISNNYRKEDSFLGLTELLIIKKKFNLAIKILLNIKNFNEKIYYQLSFLYKQTNSNQLAEKYILLALDKNPENINSLFLYAEVLRKLGKNKISIEIYNKILEINPNLKLTLVNIANCYGEIEMLHESIKFFNKYQTDDPNNIDVNYYDSQMKLKIGQFENKVFSNFDNRFFISERTVKQYYNINQKLWTGNYIDKLLVWSEQGIGDHIFFSKHLEEISSKVKNLIFLTSPRLVNLFKNYFYNKSNNNIKIDTLDNKIEDFDAHLPAGSIMRIINYNPKQNLRKASAFLKPKKEDNVFFSKHIDHKVLNIGLSWKSSNNKEIHRNIEFKTIMNSLNKNIKASFYNLQFDLNNDEIEEAKKNNLIFFNNLDYKKDIDKVASIIDNLDIVVTIQNTTAHLSCALNKKTYLLLPQGSRWYWGSENIDQWYKVATIFKQNKLFDWNEVLKLVERKIKNEQKL